MMDLNKDSLTQFFKISTPFMATTFEETEDVIIKKVTDAYKTLDSLCKLVDERRNMLKKIDAQNIEEYNNKYVNHQLNIQAGQDFWPSIIVIIDEFGKLMMTDSNRAEIPMIYLCKYGADVGIYLIASTKHIEFSIINQNIKKAFQGKIIFKCSSTNSIEGPLADKVKLLKNEGEFFYINENNYSKLEEAKTTKEEIMEVTDFIYIQPGPIEPMPLPELDKTEPTVAPLDPYLPEAARMFVALRQGSTSMMQRMFAIGYNRAGKIMEQLENLGIIGPASGSGPREVLVDLEKLNVILSTYNNSPIIGEIVPSDYQLFKKEFTIKETKNSIDTYNTNKKGDNTNQVSSQKELKALIGLNSVKEEISSLANFIKLNQRRVEQGLPMTNISFHCVFTGNPGTGKTTVARLLAGIFKELGVLKKGQLIETDRSGLVAEYIGQTAIKTNKIIDSALDGVLFIDEAYTLAQAGTQDYGHEAIATLLKRMEDNRDRLVVVLAGYGEEMKMFIDSNPCLKSRFNRYINFPDYSAEELMAIFKLYLKKQQYELSSEALNFTKSYLSKVVSEKQIDFGNARFVRNLFEKTIEQQANRLADVTEFDKRILKVIEKEDIIKGIERMS